jgi:putative peptidoglycan lipid II flippase
MSNRMTASKRGSILVAAGILLSRVAGLIRLRVFSHYFGITSEAADAFNAAFRIPNFLQNLFGEGVLSASFIPVYAGLLARERKDDADRVAGAVFAILALITSALVLAGVLLAPWLIFWIAPGFSGTKRDLTIALVRILFPGAGLLVLSAWCLGILNSHRRFLLSYAAPVIWNAVMIGTLLWFGRFGDLNGLAVALAWGSVAGSALQFLTQLGPVTRLLGHLRIQWHRRDPETGSVVRNFVPVFISRGVVQISAYIDAILASLLPTGAVAALFNAQVLYTLPVSLFGMSVSAAELPAMAGIVAADTEVAGVLRDRLHRALGDIAYFVVPSAVAFLALGDVVAGAVLQTGRFTAADADYVWGILAGSSVGLLASTMGRLYNSTFYALRDTRTPLRFAIVRVVVATALGWFGAVRMGWGAPAITGASGIAAWLEFALLKRSLSARIGKSGAGLSLLAKLWICAAVAAGLAFAAKQLVAGLNPVVVGASVLGVYGVVYFGATAIIGISQARAVSRRLLRR